MTIRRGAGKLALLAAVVGGSVLAMAGVATADSVAFSPTSGGSINAGYQFYGNDGYVFTVGSSAIEVTQLGYYHDTAAHSNPVGIYRVSDSVLMGSTNVTTTGGSPAADPATFDYTPTSIALAANTQYVLVGFESYFNPTTTISRQYVTGDNATSMNPAAGISWDYYRFNWDTGGLSIPTYIPGVDLNSTGLGNVYMGPNLQFEVLTGGSQAVPLPAAAGVGFSMLGGFGFLAAFRKRLRRGARIAS